MNALDPLPTGITIIPLGAGFRSAYRVDRAGVTVGFVWLVREPHGARGRRRAGRLHRPIRWQFGRALNIRGLGHRHTRWQAMASLVHEVIRVR